MMEVAVLAGDARAFQRAVIELGLDPIQTYFISGRTPASRLMGMSPDRTRLFCGYVGPEHENQDMNAVVNELRSRGFAL